MAVPVVMCATPATRRTAPVHPGTTPERRTADPRAMRAAYRHRCAAAFEWGWVWWSWHSSPQQAFAYGPPHRRGGRCSAAVRSLFIPGRGRTADGGASRRRYGSPRQRTSAADRRDDVEDRLAGGGCAVPV